MLVKGSRQISCPSRNKDLPNPGVEVLYASRFQHAVSAGRFARDGQKPKSVPQDVQDIAAVVRFSGNG